MKSFAWLLALLLCFHAAQPAALQQQDRELAGLAEEQVLLKRQLERLQKTMEVLLARIETEGRSRAAELLREGLLRLAERKADNEALTLGELMDQAQKRAQGGQVLQAIQDQERIIADLQHLLDLLMDRQDLDALQERIASIEALQRELGQLASQQRTLEQRTQALQENAKGPVERALAEELARLEAAQRALLGANEDRARASGRLELETLQRELSELLTRQQRDTTVLESWEPAEAQALAAASEPLDAARVAAQRAQRLAEARAEVERARKSLEEQAADPAAQNSAAHNESQALERSSERSARVARASLDPAAAVVEQALERAAQALEQAAATEVDAASEARSAERAAQALTQEAELLARAQAQEEARAEQANAAARGALEALAQPARSTGASSPAAEKAAEVDEQLRAAQNSAGSSPNEAGQAAQRAAQLEQAAQKLQEALDEQRQLGSALSASQSVQAREAQRLAQAAKGLPGLDEDAARATSAALESAAEAMRKAATAAREGARDTAGAQSREAQAALERAQRGLEQRAAQAREGSPENAEQAAEQAALAQATHQAREQASAAELAPAAAQALEQALEAAEQAMQTAGQELSSGASGAAAKAQRGALQQLQQAAEAARSGLRPVTPQQQAEAEAQALEQQRIEEQILQLAERLRQREPETESPDLERASAAADKAGQQLQQGELDQAQESEAQVRRELERAQEELQKEQDQYERLRQEELLFKIAEEVKGALEKHRAQMAETREVETERATEQSPSRAQKLRLRRIAREEQALSERLSELGQAIEQEGSLVFAELFAQAASDLGRIAFDLDEQGGYQTGEGVQSTQADVEEALVWMEEALAQERQRREQDQQQNQPPDASQSASQSGESQNRLVPDAAELKLLRRMEVDLQDAVGRLTRLYPELLEEGAEIDSLILDDVQRLATRHERVSQLFAQFKSRLGVPDAPPGDELREELEGRAREQQEQREQPPKEAGAETQQEQQR